MKIEQRRYIEGEGWKIIWTTENSEKEKTQVVFVFWERDLLLENLRYQELKEIYPNANIVYTSDSGAIVGTTLYDKAMTASALYFEKTEISFVSETVLGYTESYEVWKRLWQKIDSKDTKHIILLSEWIGINGSEIIKGIKEEIAPNITLSWGLAWDYLKFKRTYSWLNDTEWWKQIIWICLSWESLQVWFGSVWGRDPYGIDRTITKSSGNILYEIDGQPALDIYRAYLWDLAKEVEIVGHIYPLRIKSPEGITLTRTIFSIDEEKKSVTFWGDIPEGYKICLVKANIERLIDGAGQAAKNCLSYVANPEFALLISCAWRRFVLKQRTEDELENVRFILGNKVIMGWFYSHGEIAPMGNDKTSCYLHSQTMTITTFRE